MGIIQEKLNELIGFDEHSRQIINESLIMIGDDYGIDFKAMVFELKKTVPENKIFELKLDSDKRHISNSYTYREELNKQYTPGYLF